MTTNWENLLRQDAEGQVRNNIAHRARRRTLRDCYRAAVDALTASLRLTATEAEHHISRIEAAAADSFQTEMSKMCTTPEGRQKLRDAAIALGQLGISGFEDVEKMVVGYYVMDLYGVTVQHIRELGRLRMAFAKLSGGKR